MENLDIFKTVEIVAWVIASLILYIVFRHFLVFLGISIFVRYLYICFKNSQLEYLKIIGKTVVVTGCDTGFGFFLAKRLYHKGFNVFATCLDTESDGAQSLKGIESDPTHHVTVVQLDVTSDSMVQEVLARVQKECAEEGLWGLVNNAGQNFIGDAELTTMDQYLKLSDINVYGMVRMCKAFLPLIRKAQGRIVNVTSVKGLISLPVNAPYTMTKYAAEAFSDALRQEMAGFGVKVIVVEPSNFGGATGCLNNQGLARIENQLSTQWEAASEDVRQFYGRAHLEKHLENAKKSARTSEVDVHPVMDAFEDALRNVSPRTRYLVDGKKSFSDVDIYAMIARLSPFLPQGILDKVLAFYFPYTIYNNYYS